MLAEGNTNYGENLVLWDQLFGTYFNPDRCHLPSNIGISGRVADSFIGQLLQPFSHLAWLSATLGRRVHPDGQKIATGDRGSPSPSGAISENHQVRTDSTA